MLGVAALNGTDSSENQAPLLLQVIKVFGITAWLGFIVADMSSAHNRDTPLDFISDEVGIAELW